MAKHNPTRQDHGMYEELNEKGASHSTPHKDLNASAPAELNRHPNEYSRMYDKMNFKSPVQITQINGYKSQRGHVSPDNNNTEISMTLGQKESDFMVKQIPNTEPKFRPKDDLSITEQRIHQRSKSNIFHQ